MENGYEEYLRRFYIKERLSESANRNEFLSDNLIDPARLRLGPSGGIHDFFAIFYGIMKLDSPMIITCPAYPDNIIAGKLFTPTLDNPTPKIPTTITWRVITRRYAPIRGGVDSNRREMKPRIIEEVAQLNEDEILSTLGNNYMNVIQFDCWEKTHYQSELLASYLEFIMVQYAGLFKEHGVKEVLFRERSEDRELLIFKIPVVSLRFDVITQQVYYISNKRIQEIRAKFSLKN